MLACQAGGARAQQSADLTDSGQQKSSCSLIADLFTMGVSSGEMGSYEGQSLQASKKAVGGRTCGPTMCFTAQVTVIFAPS